MVTASSPVLTIFQYCNGASNWKMEVRSVLLSAMITNSAVCMPPNFTSSKHDIGSSPTAIGSLYDISRLRQVVAIVDLEADVRCTTSCKCCLSCADHQTSYYKSDVLAGSQRLECAWLSLIEKELGLPAHEPLSEHATRNAFRKRFDALHWPRCIMVRPTLGPQFTLPSLYFKLWQHLTKPTTTLAMAELGVRTLTSGGARYLGMHWRFFEQGVCPKAMESPGLCMAAPAHREFYAINLEHLVLAVKELMQISNCSTLFLATDGRHRSGAHVVDSFRARIGTSAVREYADLGLPPLPPNVQAEVAQAVLSRSEVTFGSPTSTFFLEVMLEQSVRSQRKSMRAFARASAYETHFRISEIWARRNRTDLELKQNILNACSNGFPFVLFEDTLPLTVVSDQAYHTPWSPTETLRDR
eukprot:1166775-Pleurochrysis_carterae.AAC.2